MVAGTMLTGAGQFGRYIGEVIITKIHEKLQVESAKLIDVKYDLSATPDEKERVANYHERGHQLLNESKIAKNATFELHTKRRKGKLHIQKTVLLYCRNGLF